MVKLEFKAQKLFVKLISGDGAVYLNDLILYQRIIPSSQLRMMA